MTFSITLSFGIGHPWEDGSSIIIDKDYMENKYFFFNTIKKDLLTSNIALGLL